jgi:hypothetical protein
MLRATIPGPAEKSLQGWPATGCIVWEGLVTGEAPKHYRSSIPLLTYFGPLSGAYIYSMPSPRLEEFLYVAGKKQGIKNFILGLNA